MDIALWICTIVGAAVLGFFILGVVVLLLEAAWFAAVVTFIHCYANWQDGVTFRRKVSTVRHVLWSQFWFRLSSSGVPIDRVEGNGWTFEPPLSLPKRKKPKAPAKEDE